MKALGKISTIYGNAQETKRLAQKYGFSKEDVKQILKSFANEMKNEGNKKHLEPCYDSAEF